MRTSPILAGLATAGLMTLTACGNTAAPATTSAAGPDQPPQTTASVPATVPATTAAAATATAAPTTATASTPVTTRPAAGTAPSPPATRRVVLAPVTARGAAAAGYRVVVSNDLTVECSSSSPSPVALSRNVYDCTPSAAKTDVCWPAAAPQHALCLRNPWTPTLAEVKTSAPLRPARATTAPRPLGLELSDGDHCRIRDGGAWGSPQGHPNYVGFYTCIKHQAVWGTNIGINTSSPTWTVLVGAETGPLVARNVVKAYYVTTAG
jgi:hypothetical protein